MLQQRWRQGHLKILKLLQISTFWAACRCCGLHELPAALLALAGLLCARHVLQCAHVEALHSMEQL